MERELRRQKSKATILFDQLIKEKSSKCLHHYLRKSDHPGPDYHTWKYTPPHSSTPSTSSSSSHRKRSEPVPSPEPIPIPPPQSISGTWKYPIIISDDEEEFPIRDSKWTTLIINNWEGEIDWEPIIPCEFCGSTLHRKCREGMVQDTATKFWYYKEDYNVDQA